MKNRTSTYPRRNPFQSFVGHGHISSGTTDIDSVAIDCAATAWKNFLALTEEVKSKLVFEKPDGAFHSRGYRLERPRGDARKLEDMYWDRNSSDACRALCEHHFGTDRIGAISEFEVAAERLLERARFIALAFSEAFEETLPGFHELMTESVDDHYLRFYSCPEISRNRSSYPYGGLLRIHLFEEGSIVRVQDINDHWHTLDISHDGEHRIAYVAGDSLAQNASQNGRRIRIPNISQSIIKARTRLSITYMAPAVSIASA